MPVARTSKEDMELGNRPSWSDVTSAGVFRIPVDSGTFDCHYHDCHEYWLVFKGKAKVMSEGQEYYVEPGDIVCTRAGDEHDVLEVYEDLEAFWFEDKVKGHPVQAKSLPEDFPE
jgi:mannose-6-phosphate isomerase-like protein (cupin superfamily)